MKSQANGPALPPDSYLAERIVKIRNIGRRALADSLTLGKLCWECKARVADGKWGQFCEIYLEIRVQNVNRLIRAFQFSETENGKTLVGLGASWFVLTLLCCAADDDIEAIVEHARQFRAAPSSPIVGNLLRARKTRDRADGANNHPSREALKAELDGSVASDALKPIRRWLRDNGPKANFVALGEAAIALIAAQVARRNNIVELPSLSQATEAVQLSLAMAGPQDAA